jgi:hypothetical protein
MVDYEEVSELDTVYFKTDTSGEDSLAKQFFERDLAVVHYCDFPVSFNEDELEPNMESGSNWEDNRNTLKSKVGYINEWVVNGAVVGVENKSVSQQGVMLGYVPPAERRETGPPTRLLVCSETDIKAAIQTNPSDTWKDIYRRRGDCTEAEQEILDELEDHQSSGSGGSHNKYIVFQALKLEDTMWAWYRNHPPLHAYRKEGTCHRWKQNRNYLRIAVSGGGDGRKIMGNEAESNNFEREVKFLSDGQLEILCAEYLRREVADLFVQELPVGRSRSTVDITGYDPKNETLYLAQVTFEDSGSNLKKKVRSLVQFTEGSENGDYKEIKTFFFSDAEEQAVRNEFQNPSIVDDINNIQHISTPYRWAAEGPMNDDDWKLGREALVQEFLTVPNPRESDSPNLN